MKHLRLSRKALAFLFLCRFQLGSCQPPLQAEIPPQPSSSSDSNLTPVEPPKGFEPHLNRLELKGYFQPNHIYSTLETGDNLQPKLINALHKDGKDYDPELIYLGKNENQIHLAVALFTWDAGLYDLQPRRDDERWRHKSGFLAMELTANSEPHIVGIVWYRDARQMQWRRSIPDRYRLNELEAYFAIKDVQRFIHLYPRKLPLPL